MPDSPTARARKYYTNLGYSVSQWERWNAFAKIRQDGFGFIDFAAIKEGDGIIGVQACAGSSHAARRTKILNEPMALVWLKSGGLIDVWSCVKKGPAGKRKVWVERRESITQETVIQYHEQLSTEKQNVKE